MKILFISAPFSEIKSASYRNDIHQELISIFDCKTIILNFFKNGQSYFSKQNQLFIENNHDDYDYIILGHSFLTDNKNFTPLPHNSKFLSLIRKPKIIFINKEYNRLKEKMKAINELNVDLIVSHLSNFLDKITSQDIKLKSKVYFMPFGFNNRIKFLEKNKNKIIKKYNLFFSGVIENPTYYCDQQIYRKKILNKLFFNLFGVKLLPKKKNIFWNSFSGNKLINKINRYRRLTEYEYLLKMSESKMVFGTLSFDLITPRIFECLSLGCIPLLIESEIYDIIPNIRKFSVFLKKDLSNFQEMYDLAINKSSDDKLRREIINYAHSNFSYEKRISLFKIFLDTNFK